MPRVLVTGGTGFVGSHSVRALRDAGHDVRLLVRRRDRVAPALDPLGVDGAVVEVLEGDATDAAAVREAVAGCDAVLHAANVFTWDVRRTGGLVDVNTRTTEVVLEAALAAGARSVVHVSSVVAFALDAGRLTAASPVTSVRTGYTGSKAAAERVARQHQDRGAPVHITYPGAVVGPHDPHLGDSTRLVLRWATDRRPAAGGLLALVDVRDVAAAHAALATREDGHQRVLLTGHDVPMADLVRATVALAGSGGRPVTPPAPALRAAGRVMDVLGRAARLPMPAGRGPLDLVLDYPGADTSSVTGLGVAFRAWEETLRDTVAWFREAGHLPAVPATAGSA